MIGIVVAMQSEAEILTDLVTWRKEVVLAGRKILQGSAFGKEIVLSVCGVGKVNAAAGACLVLQAGADILFNFGVAGGLTRERTLVAETYLIDRAVQYDFDLVQLNGGTVGTLDGETQNFLPLFCPDGLGFQKRALGSGDRFNDSAADHNLLLELGADIRDMEGAAIAQIAKIANIPFVSVKSISDVYGSGSTTAQYLQNKERALANLKSLMPDVIRSIPTK